MSFRFSILVTCAAISLASASHAEEVTLGARVEDLLAFAREHSPDIASTRHDAEAAHARIESAGALPDPKFRTEWRDITRMGEQNPTLLPGRVGSTRYLMMQELPWFGKRDLKRQTAEAMSESAQWRVSSVQRELVSRIKATYAQLYFLQDMEGLTREIRDLMGRLEQIAQARYANGLVAQQDVIRAQLEQTSLSKELIALENQRSQLQAVMNALIGRPADAALAPPAQIWPLPAADATRFASLLERARHNNPPLQVETAQIMAAEKSRDLAYKNRFPDFSVGVSPIQYGRAVQEWELMVEIDIPLQQGSRRAQELESEAMLAAARARREAVTNQALADLQENVTALESARRTLVLIKESQLPQAELTFRSALAGYENGKVDFATLLEAQKQLHQTRLNRVETEMNARMRLAEIERVAGEE